jgi:uncharacterized membrane protein YkvA (DUF1232 family)
VFKDLVARTKRNETVAAVLGLNWRGRMRLVCRLLTDRRVPCLPRLILPLLALYLLSPIDLVPDFIPVLGQLDDLLIVLAAAWVFTKLAPPGIVVQIASELAAQGWARDED